MAFFSTILSYTTVPRPSRTPLRMDIRSGYLTPCTYILRSGAVTGEVLCEFWARGTQRLLFLTGRYSIVLRGPKALLYCLHGYIHSSSSESLVPSLFGEFGNTNARTDTNVFAYSTRNQTGSKRIVYRLAAPDRVLTGYRLESVLGAKTIT